MLTNRDFVIIRKIKGCKTEEELRSLSSSLLAQGISNNTLLSYFEHLRPSATNEDQLLNVMVAIDDWCAEHYKLK